MWDWLNGLADAANSAIDDVVAFLLWLVGILLQLFEYLYIALVAVFNFFYSLAQQIGKFFETLWNDFFKGIFTSLYNALVRVHAWLENILRPVIQFLQKIRKWVDWIFQTYVKPFLNILNHIRSFLNILRAFGIKWAAALDQAITKVEGDIAGAFSKVQGYLNSVIGIVSSLADPLGLFRGPTFVMSMRRIFPSFLRGVSGLPVGYFFPSPKKKAPPGMAPPPTNFNPGDPAQNPPPSTYMGYDDGLGSFGGWDGSDPLAPTDADSMQSLDYFNDSAYPPPDNPDPVDAANNAWDELLGFNWVSTP